MTDVKSQDVQALIELFDESSWTELHIRLEDFELHLNKDANARHGLSATEPAPLPAPPQNTASAAQPGQASPASTEAAPETPSAPADQGEDIPEGMTVLRAPNLGTFYKSPKPGAPPYVEVGQQVEADTEVCLIEVMKLFTPVKAGTAGIIRKILVSDADLVEFDQPLFLIEPVDS